MEPWEALDVDDSDLPFLLRRCNSQNLHHRRRRQTNLHNHTTSHSQHCHDPIPEPNFSPLSRPEITSPTVSQTPHSPHSQKSQQRRRVEPRFEPTPPPETSSSRRLIPGPAGAVQTAMLRKARANRNPACGDGYGGEDSPISTQDYIRKVVEEGEDDDDFDRNPWICALEFLDRHGMVDNGLPITPLSSIKKCLNIDRIDQVVAIIKSCTPNGLGNLIATLKDPTGTIGASIHRSVLAESEFGREISVGSVLILKKVAVFTPSQSAYYLNITLRNLVKVISKDSGPTLNQNYPVSALKPVVLDTKHTKKSSNIPETTYSETGRSEGAMEDIRQYHNVRGAAHINEQIEKGNPLPRSSQCRDQNYNLGKEPLVARQNAAEQIIKRAVRIDDAQRGLEDMNKLQKGGYPLSSFQNSSSAAKLVQSHNDQEIWRGNEAQKKRKPLVSRASLPEWTDEQLKELFAADCEGGESPF